MSSEHFSRRTGAQGCAPRTSSAAGMRSDKGGEGDNNIVISIQHLVPVIPTEVEGSHTIEKRDSSGSLPSVRDNDKWMLMSDEDIFHMFEV